ncbi:MAG TPA: 3-dehydroquinate synthase family protein [Chlamydiales bacterium]|nr:3-dehydroquinate synthase family protein [Chlamydiales bacterium]
MIGRGILKTLEIPGRVIVIADKAIADIHTIRCDLLIRVSSEKTKQNYESIVDQLFQAGCDRQTTIVAIGGGTICDLVGYVAATFMRGLPLILIPTTLLAIVDASIGGKTAIDTAHGKNLIGSLHFPKMIYADLDVLSTLPEGERINGMAEILKMGLIQEPTLFIQKMTDEMIVQAMLAKISVIEKDPEEKGLRRILNFGHTIGHAIETVGENIAHGRAVALGSLAESYLSMLLGFLDETTFKEIVTRYQEYQLHLPADYSRLKIFEMMRHDKKKKDGNLRTVIIDQIGNALRFQGEYCHPVTEKQIEATLDWLEKHYT